jgi:hypothetical protein
MVVFWWKEKFFCLNLDGQDLQDGQDFRNAFVGGDGREFVGNTWFIVVCYRPRRGRKWWCFGGKRNFFV